jgi:hypothetical protein
MSSERMQQFLKGVAKSGNLTYEKFYAPLPYDENTPMSNVCAAFVRDYNKICDAKVKGEISPQAAATNIARLHEDTFGDARTEKYAKFNDLFFGRALADTPENKGLLAKLKETYVASTNPFDNSLMADLIVGSVVRGASWPFRVVGNFRREANRRDNIKIMAGIDAAASSIERHSAFVERALLDPQGKELRQPTPESMSSISAAIAQIDPEALSLHEKMDLAERKRILSAMSGESVDRIDAANNALLKSRKLLDDAAVKWPDMAESCKKQMASLDALLDGGETIRAEVRAHAAHLEFQSKNMEEILRLRIETGESLSKSDIKVIETAYDDIKKRRLDLEKTVTGSYAKTVGENDKDNRLKEFRDRMEAFDKRMGKINELLVDPKVSRNFISEDLKAKLKDLVNPDAFKKIGEALRSLFKFFEQPK